MPLRPRARQVAPVRQAFCLLLAILGAPGIETIRGNPAAALPPRAPAGARARAHALNFERNNGQTDAAVKFLARGNGYTVFLTETETVLTLRAGAARQTTSNRSARAAAPNRDAEPAAVIRMRLGRARPPQSVEPREPSPARSHYIRGNDPRQWRTDVPTFRSVAYTQVYDGIDLLFHGSDGELEYDFVIAPGADPRVIRLQFEGTDPVRLDERGDLVLRAQRRELRQPRPSVFQDVDGRRQPIEARYVLHGKREAGFALGTYDRTRPVIIDPVLVYSTYIGGSIPGANRFTPHASGQAIAADAAGNSYVTGSTDSPDFPTANPLQPELKGLIDAFVAKIAPDGTLLYSTFLGGAAEPPGSACPFPVCRATSQGTDIAVDPSGNIYVAGYTGALDFPVTPGAYLSPAGPNDAFIVKLNPSGSSLVYSTMAYAQCVTCNPTIALDSTGSVWLTGGTQRDDVPLVNPLQPARAGAIDAIVLAMNPAGTALRYATYLGGTGDDDGSGIAVGADDTVYLVGRTASLDFPVVNAAQPTFGGGFYGDCWVAHLNAAGSALSYSTFLGGGDSELDCHIAAGPEGSAYIGGGTPSIDFPVRRALQPVKRVGIDAFVTKLDAAGAPVYSTYLGGNQDDFASSIAVDEHGNAYLTGMTTSPDFPVVGFAETLGGPPGLPGSDADAFVTKIHASGAAVVYSTDIGGNDFDLGYGIAVDPSGAAHVTGSTDAADFPVKNAFQPSAPVFGEYGFILKIADPACGEEVTGSVDVLSIGNFHVPFTPLRFALVFLHNRGTAAVPGPLSYVMDDLRHAVFVGSRLITRCVSSDGDPVMVVDAGPDRMLAPGETVVTGLWFYQLDAQPITYTPRILSGVTSR